MEGSDGRFLDRSDHPLRLTVRPRMVGFGKAVLDTVLGADRTKDMADEATLGSLVTLNELHAVISQNRMDLVGDGYDEGF